MSFRPDIEGLRAVAVLTVLGFHASVPVFTGGYIGVDVFFVISGFLITGLLLRQLRETGRIRLAEFYARRSRRILPAAAVVLVGTAAASWLVLPPLRQKDLAWDVVASALNVANWRYVSMQTDYLAAGQAHSPLLHYWSLAVEEQFYLLWAPLLMVVALLSRRLIAPTMIVLTAGSFALSLYWTQISQPLAYLASPSRAWQFGLGGLLALVVARRLPTPVAHSLGLIGFVAIIASTALYDSATAFPGWAALLPTLGTAAIIWAGPSSIVGRALSAQRVRQIGRLSFAWYLWHWPVLVLFDARLGEQPWPVKLLLVLGSALPAWLTMRLVERPLRFSRTLQAGPQPSLSLGAAAIAIPVALALVLGSSAARQLQSPAVLAGELIGAAEGPNLLVNPVPGPFPAPVAARDDHPAVGECQVEPAAITSPPCRFGSYPDAAERVVLFGDSHAAQWFPAAERIASARGWAVEVLTKSGCPVPELQITNPQLGRDYHECDTWRTHALDRITTGPAPKLIIVGTLNRYSADREELLSAWAGPLARLLDTGAPLAYVRDTPIPGIDVPVCASEDPARCAVPSGEAIWNDPLAEEAPAGLTVVDVNEVLCTSGSCPAVRDGVLLYRDDSHLTNTAVTALAPRVERLLVQSKALWQLQFRDDFAGAFGAQPSAANWRYDLGHCYPGCVAQNWGTGEIADMTDRPENVSLDGTGHLAITPLRAADGSWTSGRIETVRSDFAVPPGGVLRVEGMLQLPSVTPDGGMGYWPAFWMMGEPIRSNGYTGWPQWGELDLMEQINGRPGVFAAVHAGSLDKPVDVGSDEHACADCSTAFHAYAMELTDDEVRFYLDGELHHLATRAELGEQAWKDATSHGFFLILNVAIGGFFTELYGGGPTDTTVSGRPLLVDYVAVYTR